MPPQERRHEEENQPPRAIHSRGGTAPNDHSCGRPAQRIKPSPQSAGWGGRFFCGWTGSGCGSHGLTTGVVRHACRLRRDGTRGLGFRATCRLRRDGTRRFLFGGFFCGWTGSRCRSQRLTTGVVRHACRLRRDGTRRFLFGGFFCGWTGSGCGSQRLTTGVVRHACRLRRDGTRGLGFRATCRLRRGRHEGVRVPGYVPPQERTARGS